MKDNWRFCAKLGLIGLMTLGFCFAQQIIDRLLERPPLDERLINAAANGDEQEMESALRSGASPLAKNLVGRTALCYAAQTGDLYIVRRLLQAGADVNEIDGSGMTPLMWATNSHKLAMVKLLCEHGADPFISDAGSVTALDIAEQYDDPDIAEFLRSLPARESLASLTHH